jgi:hypothetical protein
MFAKHSRVLLIALIAIVGAGLALGCSEDRAGEQILSPLAPASTTMRPIEEFVAAQGTYCLDDGMGGCLLFVPPIENFLGWSDPDDALSLSVDYAGLADRWIMNASGGAMTFGTTFAGTVRERALYDGRAEVQVVLHTRNALTWGVDGFDFTGPLVFGYRAPDVLNDGAVPALGSSMMKFTFVNTAPGAPLPDLMQVVFAPEEGQELVSVRFSSQAAGDLREGSGYADGTPGKAIVSETGLFMTGFHGAVGDGFPAENIVLIRTGDSRMGTDAKPSQKLEGVK